jgi:ATP-binding cassette subfamily B protein
MTTAAGRTRRVRLDDDSITRQRVRPGTVRRILPYAARYRGWLVLLLSVTVVHAVVVAVNPLILKVIIDNGIVPRRTGVVVWLCLAVAGTALLDAAAGYLQAWASGRIGEGLVYDLRTSVFEHVQAQPIAFFTRAQTGSLVSRLNTDVIGAREALTMLLSQSVATVLSLVLVLAAMFWLSWQIALAALAMVPLFLLPARLISRRVQRLARETMQLDADMSSLMNERFNVSGALLAKLYGSPERESRLFAGKAARVRDVVAVRVVTTQLLAIVLTVLTGFTTALVYGLGGVLTVHGTLKLGTLVAMIALLMQLYGPINQLSMMQATVLTALVSFDRVFEVLDLQPLVTERAAATSVGAGAGPATGDGSRPGRDDGLDRGLDVQFDGVCFRYPRADEVSLASLETIAAAGPERAGDGWVLEGLSFSAPAGKLTALVGPSGAGKTTIIQLVPRLYDPVRGTVRIGGQDVRDLTLGSLREAVGVVTQDAHLFHDTLRANLAYARPEATDEELAEACRGALIWDTVRALPDGLDTVVGDRGYRMSGGEKQRIALARLLLKAPPIVVLDEATAHLDSESEAAIQDALRTALTGRTSLVIAHRLSTVRDADQILVIEAGRIRERGTHDELLAAGGLYTDLHRTQFAHHGRGNSGNGRRPALRDT